MTQNTVITASQVQEGDKIKVTTQDGDRTNTFTGVANHFKGTEGGERRWFTADDWTLWTGYDSAVIELLDRPEPKSIVPSKNLAIVHYQYKSWSGADTEYRTAVRDADGHWTAYDADGFRMNSFASDMDLSEYLSDTDGAASELVVAFGGVAK